MQATDNHKDEWGFPWRFLFGMPWLFSTWYYSRIQNQQKKRQNERYSQMVHSFYDTLWFLSYTALIFFILISTIKNNFYPLKRNISLWVGKQVSCNWDKSGVTETITWDIRINYWRKHYRIKSERQEKKGSY